MNFAGLDVDQFPGLATLSAIAGLTNIAWLGYYLPAPSHSNAGWSGRRQALVDEGWGLAPIYVGQQTEGPGSHNVNGAQGNLDGSDCVTKMHAEGFPVGSYVYLDLENGPPLRSPQMAYVIAWAASVAIRGFGPGVYCSHDMAFTVAAALPPNARIWAFHVPTTDRTTATSPFPTPNPSGSGYPEAIIWQRAQNVQISSSGYSLVVDLDVSTMADPSAPIAVQAVLVPTTAAASSAPPLAAVVVPQVTTANSGAPVVAAAPDFSPPEPVQLPSLISGLITQALTRYSGAAAVGLVAAGVLAPNLVSPFESIVAGAGLWLASEIAAYALVYLRHQKAVEAVAVAKAS